MHDKTFWLDTINIPAATPHDFPRTVDIAIIGAGFTGLSAARSLAKSGAAVAVFDSQTIGWGASSRNGGMVLTGLKLPASTLIARYGRDTTARMYAASLESIDFVEQLVREENIACDFTRCGHLEVACKSKHFDDFRRTAEETERHEPLSSSIRMSTKFSAKAPAAGKSPHHEERCAPKTSWSPPADTPAASLPPCKRKSFPSAPTSSSRTCCPKN
jgi:glycine/D-amino acid oxidase-like deaminating enzyme